MTRILGIDPGSVVTGIGIIESSGNQLRHIHHHALKVSRETFPLRLRAIFDGIVDIIEQYRPEEVAVEQVFVSRNPESALKLGQARGAAICAALSRDCVIAEYSPRSIKQALVGKGSADKTQVAHMVGVLLNIRTEMEADASDALGVAICHAHHRESAVRLGGVRA
ncbi:MAG: crossover junction endodeoxyribonuclease RuvC [Xanthomonadales bacterium]|nr:crossover junction endodeoxyribonuclease RuvC [Xanthomonadales bacterium]